MLGRDLGPMDHRSHGKPQDNGIGQQPDFVEMGLVQKTCLENCSSTAWPAKPVVLRSVGHAESEKGRPEVAIGLNLDLKIARIDNRAVPATA